MKRFLQSIAMFSALMLVCAQLSWGVGQKQQQTVPTPATAPSQNQGTISAPPIFVATNHAPVLFRYKFKQGQTTKTKIGFHMGNQMQMGERNAVVNIVINMDAQYSVQSVDANGDARAILTMTRVVMQSDGPNPVSFDSDKDTAPDNPHLQALRAMLNVPIPVEVSALGEVLDMDQNPVDKALQRAGVAANLLEKDKTTDEIVKGSFVQLSESPVIMGDIYDAGTIVEKTEGVGEMLVKARFRVLSISGDRKLAILQPMGDFSLKPTSNSGPVTIKLSNAMIDGWILFDLEGGFIDRSEVQTSIDMALSQESVTMHMGMASTIKCQNRLE